MFPLLLALATAGADTLQSGAMEVRVDGLTTALPMVNTTVDADIHGDLATVRLTQTFENPSTAPINATYAFPLPSDAAVSGMSLVAGDVQVVAEIQKKVEAQATFEQAKAEGKQAALLSQERPNVFTQDVANLPPGEQIRVSITYVHAVDKKDGAFEWVLPVAVGPRYVPAKRDHEGEPEPLEMGTWTIPQGAETVLPDTIEAGRLAVSVDLYPGAPLTGIDVPSHSARIGRDGAAHTIALSGRMRNRDLVVRYQLADEELAAGTTAFAENGHGVVSLLIDPPAGVAPDRLTPRELVYVLDTSGSMSGMPMDTVKRFMHRSLDTLRPGDHFRLIRFGSNASEFAKGALPFNAETAALGHGWIDAIQARGGTEMRLGINTALDAPPVPGTVRTVVFLTDGYIGNDVDVIRLLESKDGGARLFALGVGGSVNRWLLEEMARVGRGVARVVTDPTESNREADALAKRLSAPYLTDISIDWGDAPVREVTPATLPDLFLGEPLRVMARFDGAGTHTIQVKGRIAGSEATLPLKLELPEASTAGAALPLTWARSQVEDSMHSYLSPMTSSDERLALEQRVTTLGLEYGLATQWTSFVAVVPEPVLAKNGQVPAAPQQVNHAPSPSNHTNWGGSAAPEPAGWAAMFLVALMGGLASRRRKLPTA